VKWALKVFDPGIGYCRNCLETRPYLIVNIYLVCINHVPYVNLGIDSLFICLGYSSLVCCQNPQFIVLVTRSGSMNIMGNLYIVH
jgi:hypothetical protein